MYIYVYIYIYKYTDTTGQSGHRVSRPRGTGSVGDSVGEGALSEHLQSLQHAHAYGHDRHSAAAAQRARSRLHRVHACGGLPPAHSVRGAKAGTLHHARQYRRWTGLSLSTDLISHHRPHLPCALSPCTHTYTARSACARVCVCVCVCVHELASSRARSRAIQQCDTVGRRCADSVGRSVSVRGCVGACLTLPRFPHARLSVCLSVCMHACMCACTYVCVYVCMYVYVCACVCVCVCMHGEGGGRASDVGHGLCGGASAGWRLGRDLHSVPSHLLSWPA